MINKILFLLMIPIPLYFLFEYGFTEQGLEYVGLVILVEMFLLIIKYKIENKEI